MEISEKQIIYYTTIDNKCPYEIWYNKLDKSLKVFVDKRIEKLKIGNYGDCKPLQNSELNELRMSFGKGYRIYYYDLNSAIILFVAGSDKKDQKKVIQKANLYFEDFKERLQYEVN